MTLTWPMIQWDWTRDDTDLHTSAVSVGGCHAWSLPLETCQMASWCWVVRLSPGLVELTQTQSSPPNGVFWWQSITHWELTQKQSCLPAVYSGDSLKVDTNTIVPSHVFNALYCVSEILWFVQKYRRIDKCNVFYNNLNQYTNSSFATNLLHAFRKISSYLLS